jgi:hypothetical protein
MLSHTFGLALAAGGALVQLHHPLQNQPSRLDSIRILAHPINASDYLFYVVTVTTPVSTQFRQCFSRSANTET